LPNEPDVLPEPGPDTWDRLAFDVDLVREDFGQFFSPAGLGGLALGLGLAAPLANTSADRDVRNWYQDRIRTGSLNPLSSVANYGGQFWFVVPLWMEYTALRDGADDSYYLDGGIHEWSNRSLRAVAVGYVPVIALYGLLGSGRPDSNDSHWQPFRHFHGVSGHTFMGAVPFLTAAAMTDNPLYQVPLVAGSFLTGWSRIHEDRHYLSQVALGWWIAWLTVQAVDRTQRERSVSVVPTVTEAGPGLGLQWQY
jgi:PAP2 superfamily